MVVIAAALVGVAFQMGAMQGELISKSRSVAALQADNRELRGLVFRHLESHSLLDKEEGDER